MSGVTSLFADDSRIYRQIITEGDEKLLQADLDNLIRWASTWGMRFNASKCKTMQISRKRDPGEPAYEMNGERLEATQESTYLVSYFRTTWDGESRHSMLSPRLLGFSTS